MSCKQLPLLVIVLALACGDRPQEEGALEAASADTLAGATAMLPEAAPRFSPSVAMDPCVLVEPDRIAAWTGSEVRRLEARLPTVGPENQARAGCVAFPRSGAASDVPVFELDLRRPVEASGSLAGTSPGDGVAFAKIGDTAFELRCERCGERIHAALDSIVTSYEALKE